MTEMTLNGFDIKSYNARLLNYSVSGTAVTNNVSAVGTLLKMPSLFSASFGTRTLTITLTFSPAQLGSDARNTSVIDKLRTAAANIAKFEAEIIGKVVEITLPDGFCYTALASAPAAATFDSSGEHDVVYTFSAIRHKSKVIVDVPDDGKVFCNATTNVPCIITINSSIVISKLKIDINANSFTITNINAGVNIVIDSEYASVTCNGKNKFSDCDIVDFPFLRPGYNTITADSNIAIQVSYTPVYL